ncbi:GAF domain-containing protein [Myxococcota bacterium]|nr:GAF domain-containing protein [Myxococcota bacterium]MBU1412986.1 GAF domain-containing protein [Myxococcota bacterium]MBU1510029.1 GAF domain-containing protein [Myxococcota bacterium]
MSDDARDLERLEQENQALRRRIADLESGRSAPEEESTSSWKLIVHEAPVCIAKVALDKRFLSSNQEFQVFLGYTEEELCQKTISEITHPEDTGLGMAEIMAVVKGEIKTSRVTKRYVRKDGGIVWGEVSINVIRNESGQPIYLLAFILDVSERRKVDEMTRLSAERMKALLHLNQLTSATLQEIADFALEEAVRLTRSSLGYLAFLSEDESVLTMHSWSRAAMAECAIIDKPIVYPVASTGLWGEAVRQRRPVLTNDYAAANPLKKGCPDGHVMMTRHMNVPVFDGNRIVIVAGVGNKSDEYSVEDVQQLTLLMEGMWLLLERKRAEEALRTLNAELEHHVLERTMELEASTRELEAFSYSVSHDLRAPLRTIDGFSLALLEDCADNIDDDGKDYLRRIRAATQRMGLLIDDMLRLSRISRAEMVIEKVNLSELAWSVVHDLEKTQPERRVRIEIANGLEDRADPKLMRIALENLLGNAWKFTGRRAEAAIEFGATTDEGKRTYFVRDNGAGFDMAYVDKLFTPFQRLHSMQEYPGTGIGLGTVARILHRHGGKVWAEGEVDHGATFHFSLQR